MKKAFTLAEVLVTLAIIGVIAAVTLPNLTDNYKEANNVTKARKAYSEISQAYTSAILKYGPISEWNRGIQPQKLSERYKNRIGEFLSIEKDCGLTEEGCISSAKFLDYNNAIICNNFMTDNAAYHKVLLSDGVGVIFNSGAGRIYLDVDGPYEGENKDGFDIFPVYLNGDSVESAYNPEVTKGNVFEPSYDGMLNWIIKYGNMDYLHCSGLTWGTKVSCE